jgi:anti-sigma regulatory factor (Ser/Thr protein kinase)
MNNRETAMPRAGTQVTRSDDHLTQSLDLPGHAEEVPRARAFIARVLAAQELGTDLACLLGSELVTNAVRHSQSRLPGGTVTVTVTVSASRGEVLVEVTDDGGSAWPVIREDRDPCAEDGRGLVLVAQLSTRWGYERGDGRLTTWFRLPAEPA